MRFLIVLILATCALAAASDTPERVRISTVVTDRLGKPVAGLTVKDFELREDGVVQPLVSVEARRPEPRRLAILLDEFHISPDDTILVREALTRFVETKVRPEDQVVLLKPLDPLTSITLTTERDRLRAGIETFQGRKGVLEPRNALEEETIGRAPALVKTGRAQVVLSGLRALATQLGSAPGRSAILLVSEGFVPQTRRLGVRGLPDAGIVERFANRYDVPIYAFDPRLTSEGDESAVATLNRLVKETGGTVSRGADLAVNLDRASLDIDSGYTLTYQPTRADDGRYHPVTVAVVRRQVEARSRAGYVAPLSSEMRRAHAALASGPILPTRLLRRSPQIDVWSGVTGASDTDARMMVTWEPRRPPAGGRSTAARVLLKATTKDGTVLFDGMLSPVRIGEAPDPASPDRAEFTAPAGKVQLDMTIVGISGEKIDIDARDIDVPSMKGNTPLLLPAILIATQSAREFRTVLADTKAAPDPSRQFRRTERLVIRAPVYAGRTPLPVTGRLLNRMAQPIRELGSLEPADGISQFDLPLAAFAPGEYFLHFTIAGPTGPIDQRLSFRITG